jgi:hypothetical protein
VDGFLRFAAGSDEAQVLLIVHGAPDKPVEFLAAQHQGTSRLVKKLGPVLLDSVAETGTDSRLLAFDDEPEDAVVRLFFLKAFAEEGVS